jgi:hypothetical protein
LEVAHVRNRLRRAIDAAKDRAQSRREQVAQAEQAFDGFLTVATPVLRQLANALRVESLPFTLFTPERALRLASDRSRVDFVELTLDTSGERPLVLGRISYARGSRTIDEERALRPDIPLESISEEDVLDFCLGALEPWLER